MMPAVPSCVKMTAKKEDNAIYTQFEGEKFVRLYEQVSHCPHASISKHGTVGSSLSDS